MKIRLLAVSLWLLLAAHMHLAIAQPTQTDTTLKHAATQLTTLLSDGIAALENCEGCAGLVIHQGRIFKPQFGNQAPEAIALFSITGFGGSNHSIEYLAVFQPVVPSEIAGKKTQPYQLVAFTQIGARGWRFMDFKSAKISHQHIMLAGKQMASHDALCCPSQDIQVEFRLVANHHLIEVKKAGNITQPML